MVRALGLVSVLVIACSTAFAADSSVASDRILQVAVATPAKSLLATGAAAVPPPVTTTVRQSDSLDMVRLSLSQARFPRAAGDAGVVGLMLTAAVFLVFGIAVTH
jgi:hypothetical protein